MVRKRTKFRKVNLIAIVLTLLLCGALSFAIPIVRETIIFRYDQIRIYIRYKLFPPEEVVFVPQQQVELATLQPSPSATSTPTHTPPPTLFIEPTTTPLPSATPTLTYTPGPPKVLLEGGKYVHQHGLWNYCGPANLSMALSYWGLNVDRLVVGDYLKPFREDKSVRAYEMIDYIVNQTDLYVALRYGGTPELLKTLLANGFPVLIEKGIFMEESISHRIVWAGHYNLVVGYDDEAHRFITRDSYYSPPNYPLDYPISYDEILTEWRGFNYTFLVIYPVEKSEQLNQALGAYLDQNTAIEIATATARREIETLEGIDLFLATFNLGVNQTLVYDYLAAAETFDQAFELYAMLPAEQRPFRIMWYNSGPYFAYYYTNRYQDVIDLATTTIDSTDKPYLEESWYWRGMARLQLGYTTAAKDDFYTALKYHPGFAPAVQALKDLGLAP